MDTSQVTRVVAQRVTLGAMEIFLYVLFFLLIFAYLLLHPVLCA